MALLTRTILTSLILTYENNSSYLQIDPQGCALFRENNPEPVYRIQEPLLLAHGIMTDSKTTHLVLLKTNGDLCYTLISGTGTPQTTIIAKLDVRGTRYRRLFLFPQGKIIHIFYASTHQSIPGLWRIHHRVWNGTSWQSTHMGEVVHPREPLYHVNLDSQGNLHFLTITFQGRYSLLFTNRFNGTFHIWGSPTETLRISGEVIDMTTLMTSDNGHHLYWVVKTSSGQYELRSAQQMDAHELASAWHPSPAPIKTFNTPIKNIGALEINGILWLLAYTGEENLMQNDGSGWKLVSSHTPFRQLVQWVHKGRRNFHQTYWLEDQRVRHAPAFHHELGFSIHQQTPSPTPYKTVPAQTFQPVPPPVPAFYPEQLPSHCDPLSAASVMENICKAIPSKITPLESNTPNLDVVTKNPVADSEDISVTSTTFEVLELIQASETTEGLEAPEALEVPDPLIVPESLVVLETPQVSEKPTEKVLQPLPVKENEELQSLIKTVAHLEQENSLLSLAVQDMLSKFDQIIGVISENALQVRQEADLLPFDELEPVKEAMSHLEKETQSLSQVLQVMLVKQEERDTSLEKLETQICQLQSEKDDVKNKGGFWNKWLT
ncbi:MAG: hypothetical protein VR66_16885 [Peptococcaceae bacterium BRH_c23]|nr:MAG: hypothetical protein VR66_16885 [Peptococcaceae bacterium BRH_c23]KJS90301.1 MAG: hypothetical protein JL57_02390 [Desulfosporosinus sp. BICA1-9]HBW38538.1 hypothetical protein [Desulfosporosinus sp.]